MRSGIVWGVALSLLLPAIVAAEHEESLRGSSSSMRRQHDVALESDYTFTRTPREVARFVRAGRLVELSGNADYRVRGAAHPYARPDLRTFIERLALRYRAACGEPLVVTSLTRPLSEQPRNAHALSVHPAGMAVDLRVSARTSCQRWVADTLLTLEADGLLDVTREYGPPHFHVALFPAAYRSYLSAQLEKETEQREAAMARARAISELRSTLPAATLPYHAAATHGRSMDVLLFGILAGPGLALLLLWRLRRRHSLA